MKISAKTILAISLTVYSSFLILPSKSAHGGSISPTLQAGIEAAKTSKMTAIVFFTDRLPERIVLEDNLTRSHHRSERAQAASSEIEQMSVESMDEFKAGITKKSLDIEIVKRFAVANAATIVGSGSDILELTDIDNVLFVSEDTLLELVEPVESVPLSASASSVESHLTAIHADELWRMGLTGAGRFVLSIDTGVFGAHPGLSARWRGATTGDPSQGWFDPQTLTTYPTDARGHGTHVMGLMAGVYDGDTVGVAPDVEWGCAAVVDRGSGFSQTISDILAAFDWAADPDGNPETTDDIPDAINHSWGVPAGIFPACDGTFNQAIDNLEALGIVNVFAAGNEGPDPNSIRFPADRASTVLNAFSVGAVDHRTAGDPVADFSSRGPSSCSSVDLKPEVVAPGKSLISLWNDGGFRVMSGTSMSAPLVTGAVALLRQYNPDATVDQIKHALIMSAVDIDAPGEDNNSGYGMIDLRHALDYMPAPSHAVLMYRGFNIDRAGNGVIEPGETVDLSIDLDLVNYGVFGLWAVLGTYDTGIEIVNDSAFFGSYAAGISLSNEIQPFRIRADQSVAPGKTITMRLDFYDANGEFLNNVYFKLVLAQSQFAAVTNISTARVSVGVSNYGAIGLSDGSLINLDQPGFSVDGMNYLTEFSLIVADSLDGVPDRHSVHRIPFR